MRMLRSVAAIVAGYGVMSLTVIGGSIIAASLFVPGGFPALAVGAARRASGGVPRRQSRDQRARGRSRRMAHGPHRGVRAVRPCGRPGRVSRYPGAWLGERAGGASARLVPNGHRRDRRRGRPGRRQAARRRCRRRGSRGSVEARLSGDASCRSSLLAIACVLTLARPAAAHSPTSPDSGKSPSRWRGRGRMTPAALVLKKEGTRSSAP